jgi:hypothetical protein
MSSPKPLLLQKALFVGWRNKDLMKLDAITESTRDDILKKNLKLPPN